MGSPKEARPPQGPGQELDGAQTASPLSIIDPLDEIARHVDGAFVIVVKVSGGRYRRRVYLTAKAAENAAARATGRGEDATVYLAELKPLWRLRGGRDD